MTVTYGQLKALVGAVLRDPSNITFIDADVGNMVQMGITEVGAVAPMPFQENLTPVANTLTYTLRSAVFGGEAIPEIEVVSVEVWDGSATPIKPVMVINPAAGEYVRDSDIGWLVWAGVLSIPTWAFNLVKGNEATYLIRVWGYSPYPQPVLDADVLALSDELQKAVISYVRMEALFRLNSDRDLFAQWQTRSNNSDVSPAGLMNMLNVARDDWNKRRRHITRLRAGT